MRNKRLLIVEQLDKKIEPFLATTTTPVPNRGWINAIRVGLNMTLAQLGAKLNITRQGAKRIEESETKGTISINSLKEVAAALDLKLVYGFVPIDGSLNNLIEKKANVLAQKIVLRTHHNMQLEDQGISDDKVKQSIRELANEMKREMRRSLWD